MLVDSQFPGIEFSRCHICLQYRLILWTFTQKISSSHVYMYTYTFWQLDSWLSNSFIAN